jgi:transposase
LIGVELLVEIQFLARQGLNKTQIARRLGVDRKTVRKSLALDVDEFVKRTRPNGRRFWTPTSATSNIDLRCYRNSARSGSTVR